MEQLSQLVSILEELARTGQTLTYIEMADRLDLQGAHRITRLALMLEEVMSLDASHGEPLRAALVVSRCAPHLPRPGFFDCARRLGLLNDLSPEQFHAKMYELLRAKYSPSEETNYVQREISQKSS